MGASNTAKSGDPRLAEAEVVRPPSARLPELDISRGMIILFIAVYHSSQFMITMGYSGATGVFEWITQFQQLGLALFFVVSGMNVHRTISEPWSAMVSRRLLPLLWVLLVWNVLLWFFQLRYSQPFNPDYRSELWRLAFDWLAPISVLWFLWAIALFTVGLKLIRNVRPAIVLAVMLPVVIVLLGINSWHLRQYGMTVLADRYLLVIGVRLFVFFYFGYAFREQLLYLLRLPLLPALILFNGVGVALLWLNPSVTAVIPAGVLRLTMLMFSILGAAHVARALALIPPLGGILSALGKITLPVYLAHMPFLVMLGLALHAAGWRGAGLSVAAASIAIGLASVACSVIFNLIILRIGATWLFIPPRWVQRALAGLAERLPRRRASYDRISA